MNAYNFDGWDYLELADYFGITLADDDAKELIEFLKTKQDFRGEFPEEITKVCRAFAEKVRDCMQNQSKTRLGGGEYYLFDGLCKLEPDWTFMKYFLVLLPYMWS